MPPVQFKNLPPCTHILRGIRLPPHTHTHPLSSCDYVPWSITHFQTLWSLSCWGVLLFFSLLEIWEWLHSSALLASPASLFCSLTISQCKPTPALLVSRNWGEHYSEALYRQQFCRVIIVYVVCILGDGCIPNEEFVTHFAEWTLWCPPRQILCFRSTSS